MAVRLDGGPVGALRAAAIAFVAANLIHGADHLRQGTGRLTDEVLWGGTVLTVAALATLGLAVRRDARAPAACRGGGAVERAGDRGEPSGAALERLQ